MTCSHCHGRGSLRVLDAFGDTAVEPCPRCDDRRDLVARLRAKIGNVTRSQSKYGARRCVLVRVADLEALLGMAEGSR